MNANLSLNPLFGGAFILTRRRDDRRHQNRPRLVSIPCLAGHSFSRSRGC